MSWRRPNPTDVDVTLVDGVGRPFVMTIQWEPVSPAVLRFPHPQRACSASECGHAVPCPIHPNNQGEAQVLVHFDRSNNEHDAYGRQIYRQRGTGTPPLRAEYLLRHAAKQEHSKG